MGSSYKHELELWREHWKIKHPKVVDAVVSGNWDVLMNILSPFDGYYAKEEDSSFWRILLREAVSCERCDVIEFLVQKGWHVELDWLLNAAVSFLESSLNTVEGLCLLGAGGITSLWDSCYRLYGQVEIYGILLENNVVTPRMLFCAEGDLDENEIPQRLSLTFWLDITEDRCRKRREESLIRTVDDNEHEDVLGLTSLYARNGAPITVTSSLLEKLPKAESRVSEIMAAALQPASLQSLCRIVVRGVGPKRHFKSWVSKQGLPGRLSDFLCSCSSKA